ncbi:ac43 [Oxyplax ochracea nucleopolyhedrovirus]|uniref:Ac43 n=1 Tax=Oxyplax ochracea nucleopolyhedrovirus TaxID=2083176 RepID=A0A2L0WU60_9ABAC|nr:ac43 [Oxyplax ochracea nucleopolyhedrovirus]AVA31188.1 ac43 [Oxyplax ochracea nucleopolyhedrovirus]
MSSKYSVCYLCDDVVYLFKKQFANTSSSAAAFYRQRMAVIKNGYVLCPRCHSSLNNSTVCSPKKTER